jgi:hypothetical protein
MHVFIVYKGYTPQKEGISETLLDLLPMPYRKDIREDFFIARALVLLISTSFYDFPIPFPSQLA